MKLGSVKLLYNAAAHFAACEKYPEGLIKEMSKQGVESFDAMLWGFTEAAKQAELYRRFLGETPRKILSEAEWRLIIKPGQMSQATNMLMDAIIAGLATDNNDEDQEIDEVLAELEKKTSRAAG